MRLEVGGVYEWGKTAQLNLTYACVAFCEAETVRYKRLVPGYKLLILSVVYPEWWGAKTYAVGDSIIVPTEAHITVGVRRLD